MGGKKSIPGDKLAHEIWNFASHKNFGCQHHINLALKMLLLTTILENLMIILNGNYKHMFLTK